MHPPNPPTRTFLRSFMMHAKELLMIWISFMLLAAVVPVDVGPGKLIPLELGDRTILFSFVVFVALLECDPGILAAARCLDGAGK